MSQGGLQKYPSWFPCTIPQTHPWLGIPFTESTQTALKYPQQAADLFSGQVWWDPLSCSLRALLEDGKATVPCLAERLTMELISHICVSYSAPAWKQEFVAPVEPAVNNGRVWGSWVIPTSPVLEATRRCSVSFSCREFMYTCLWYRGRCPWVPGFLGTNHV